MAVLDYGLSAFLVEVAPERVADWVVEVSAAEGRPIVEVVAGAETVLVRLDPDRVAADPSSRVQVRSWLAHLDPPAIERATLDEVVLPVIYDGADLEPLAEQIGSTVAEVIERHTAPRYEVAFCGFMPGFAYLTGLDPDLMVPRLDRPRPSVPAGSVAIAGPYSAVYPAASPGGWRLLGRHAPAGPDEVMFDPKRFDRGVPPGRLQTGQAVRFESVDPS